MRLFILLLLHSFCCFATDKTEINAYRFMAEFAQSMESKGLKPIGSGCSGAANIFVKLRLMFQIDSNLTIESARKLIVDASEEFLKGLNNNKQLRPYLIKFPATIENISISISSTDSDGNKMPNIRSVSTVGDKINFYNDENDPDKWLIHKESFEEAVAIVEKTRAS